MVKLVARVLREVSEGLICGPEVPTWLLFLLSLQLQ